MGGRLSVERRPPDQIEVGLARRDPALEDDATWACDGEPIAVRCRLGRVARHATVGLVVADEILKVGEQVHLSRSEPRVASSLALLGGRPFHADALGNIPTSYLPTAWLVDSLNARVYHPSAHCAVRRGDD